MKNYCYCGDTKAFPRHFLIPEISFLINWWTVWKIQTLTNNIFFFFMVLYSINRVCIKIVLIYIFLNSNSYPEELLVSATLIFAFIYVNIFEYISNWTWNIFEGNGKNKYYYSALNLNFSMANCFMGFIGASSNFLT